MKLISNLASLSIAATLLLQSGSFVAATPFFNVPATSATHNDDASTGLNCQNFRVTFPSTSGISFEDNTKHVIAWQAPTGMKQVNITMVNNANPSNQAYIGTYDANRGATEEVSLSLKDQEAGEFHFHFAGLGGSNLCEVDSTTFQIKKRQQQTESTESTPESSSNASVNKEELDRILQDIQANSQDSDDNSNIHTDDSTWNDALDNVASISHESAKEQQHQNDASTATPAAKGQSFYDYINSLDQDYKKYIHKNKETESVAVTHKNDVDSNPYFTNEDRTTQHNNKAEKSWHSDDASSDSNPYFTNEDRTTKHNNEVSEKTWHSDDATVSDSKAPKTWHSNDADNYFTNEYQTSGAPQAHQNDNEWVAEESNNKPQQHLNGWTSEDNDVDVDDHLNSAEWNLPHSNDSEWYSEDDADEKMHSNGWTSEEIDVAPTHANYHQNDSAWVDEDDETTHRNGWVSEDVDEQVTAPHVNYAEWVGDGAENASGQHYNAANWQSEDADLSVEEKPDYHRNDSEWESVDTELTAEEHRNYHINDAEWVSKDSVEKHDNAVEWESEDVDLSPEDHSNYHINSNEWVSEEHNNHNNDADANDWSSEEDELTPEEHLNYHVNKAEWVSESAASSTSHNNYHQNDNEWEAEDDVEQTNTQHEDTGDWAAEDISLSQEDHLNYHQNTVEWVSDDDNNKKHNNAASAVTGETVGERSHPNYHTNKAEWVSADNNNNQHNNAADWESEDVELSAEEHRNYHINDVEWTSEENDSVPHVNLANWVATPSQEPHSNAAAEWEAEEIELLRNDHTNLREWEATPEHSNAASNEWVSEENHLDEEETHLNAVATANTNTREWTSNDAPASHSNYIPEEVELLHSDHTNSAWKSSASSTNPLNTQHSNAAGNPSTKQWQDESNATTGSHTNEWVSW